MTNKLSLLTYVLFLTLTGCSIYHVDSQDVSMDIFPPKKTAQDVVYLETVEKPHEVVAYITVNTERRQLLNDVIEKMKREAAILGADAITDIKTNATGQWKKLPAQDLVGNGYVRANFTATAIVLK